MIKFKEQLKINVDIFPGAVTFTPSGKSHGIKNTGSEMLEFIALIIKD